ncbi:MAG: RNA polymerase subunit sigma-70 [Bosea sp.]|uniref:RNA polymerase sigma factor n=1 Tax=Bosea sp. (in: a-proteobacteria) TaxID=1871050 RepID=UPI002391E186|nr:RNA polymerase subunit sigma-70 [Bosea sp. (in: a-proteobacteria)]MCP4736399.1 RNA polymerase subunit sigma-70 [Bosea sp. (in: a-proteobacteria)]
MPERQPDGARAAAEHAARSSYGRLVATLARQWRDLAAIEDALADAFHSALEHWPATGVPARPEAWLLASARNALIDGVRRGRVRSDAVPTLALLAEADEAAGASLFPDERLKLLFICAHPQIDAAVRPALMLQTVLGLDAARIAAAFLTSPAALGQRLVRAKARIRDAGLAFTVPEQADLPERLHCVLQAIYAAYGSGWEDVAGADRKRQGLTGEAIFLARLVAGLLPAEPEARGLLALILHCEARHAARRDATGAFVALSEQDTSLWSGELIDEAERELAAASHLGRLGPFQLEAAIQSVHAGRAHTGRTEWPVLAQLYEGLVQIAPTLGALTGRAAAFAEAFGPERGLVLLAELPEAQAVGYQPYWALKAQLLVRAGDAAAARDAYSRAIGLAEDPAVRSFLQKAQRRAGG